MMAKADLCTVNIIACFFFFLMLKVCIFTILINQLELIETRIAISVCSSNAGDAVLSPLARGGAVAVGCCA